MEGRNDVCESIFRPLAARVGILSGHAHGRSVAALRRAPRESSRVRDADLRPLLPVHQPASRRGGPRDRRRAAPCLRASRHRLRGALAVVGERPRVSSRPPTPTPRRKVRRLPSRCARSSTPGRVQQMLAGRMVAFSSLDGAAGGGRRRPGERPPARHQVEPDPPARGGGRAARRRPGLQHPAGGARLAGRAGEAAAAGRAGLRQRARPEAPRAEPAGERGAPGPGGGLRRGGALDPGLRHGRLLGHGEGSGDLRVLAGRGRQPGASRGVGPSRRLGPRSGSHRAVRACGRARRRGIPDRPARRRPRAVDRLPWAAPSRRPPASRSA